MIRKFVFNYFEAFTAVVLAAAIWLLTSLFSGDHGWREGATGLALLLVALAGYAVGSRMKQGKGGVPSVVWDLLVLRSMLLDVGDRVLMADEETEDIVVGRGDSAPDAVILEKAGEIPGIIISRIL